MVVAKEVENVNRMVVVNANHMEAAKEVENVNHMVAGKELANANRMVEKEPLENAEHTEVLSANHLMGHLKVESVADALLKIKNSVSVVTENYQ
jgi:hypothetical protein